MENSNTHFLETSTLCNCCFSFQPLVGSCHCIFCPVLSLMVRELHGKERGFAYFTVFSFIMFLSGTCYFTFEEWDLKQYTQGQQAELGFCLSLCSWYFRFRSHLLMWWLLGACARASVHVYVSVSWVMLLYAYGSQRIPLDIP